MKKICPYCAHEFEVPDEAAKNLCDCPNCEGTISPDVPRESTVITAKEPQLELRPGDKIGGYIIEGQLGAGGMAVVFKARQIALDRPVALKVLPSHFADNEMFVSRFHAEAAVLASLDHPNIVSVIDRGKENDIYYIVMNLIEGLSLKDILAKQKRLTPPEALRIIEQVCEGLKCAHGKGIVHRDIKPGNIMVSPDGRVRITDFGLAHLASEQGGFDLTQSGQAMGTIKYMAPEQLMSSKDVDARADIYSLGVTLYEMLTGTVPMGAFRLPSEVDPSLDVRLDDVIMKALRTNPAERYQSVDEMLADIRQIAASPLVTAEQREKEESVPELSPAVTSLVACRKCGYESSLTSRRCEKCGADLSDIFEPCPRCGEENRLDVPICAKCNYDLAAEREKKRRRTESRQIRARQLLREKKYDEVLQLLHKIVATEGREYERVRASAKLWIEMVERKRARHWERLYEAGHRWVAQGYRQRAIKVWSQLPRDYKQVAKKLAEVEADLNRAKELAREGSELARQGKLEDALLRLQLAARMVPHDEVLRNQIAQVKNRLGNQALIRRYLAESKEAEERGNVSEAIALCERVLDLDRNHVEARERLKVLQARRDEGPDVEREAELVIPRAQERELILPAPPPIKLFLFVGVVAIVALVAIVSLILMRGGDSVGPAQALFLEASKAESNGDFLAAVNMYERLMRAHKRTDFAARAKERRAKLNETILRNAELLKKAAALLAERRYRDALRTYEDMLRHPELSRDRSARLQAKEGADKVRAEAIAAFVESAAKEEQARRWREALALYKLAADEFQGEKHPSVKQGIARAQEKLNALDLLLAEGRAAEKREDWPAARSAYERALEITPFSAEAIEGMRRTIIKLPVPEGMALVAPGPFIMGSDDGDPDERPRRTAEIQEAYYIDLHEVTNAQYARFVAEKGLPPPPHWQGTSPPPGKENHPVVNITWEEAAAYARFVGKELPTELQWERAARGTDGRTYPWGNEFDSKRAILGLDSAPVGSSPTDRSELGCFDMAGNVAEWTADKTEQGVVIKGGSWLGMEDGRLTRPVLGGSPTLGVVLGDAPQEREYSVSSLTDVRMTLVGVFGDGERPNILVEKWLAQYGIWAARSFYPGPGEEIGEQKQLFITTPDGRRERLEVDFRTGCFWLGFQSKRPLIVRYRDPYGVEHLMEKPATPIARRPKEDGTTPEAALVVASVQPEAVKLSEKTHLNLISLDRTCRAANRMFGRPEGRYLNVGFRCALTPWRAPIAAYPSQKPETAASGNPQ